MPGYDLHVFVCENEREPGHPRGCCGRKGSAEIRKRLKQAVAGSGLRGKVRINKAGCLDYCEHGPTVVVYPQGVWYAGVRPEDAEEIFREHLVGGRTVERLLMRDEEK